MKNKQPQSSCKLRCSREKFKAQLSELLKFADEISQQAAFPVDQIGLSNNCNRWLTQAKTLMTDSFTSDYFCAQMIAKNNNVIDNGPVSNLCQMVRLQAEYLRGLEAQINSIPVCFCCMLHNSFKNLFGKKTMIFITFLTLLFGFTTNAWAVNHLKGSWDSWNGSIDFDNSDYLSHYFEAGEWEFKIFSNDYNTAWGNDGTINDDIGSIDGNKNGWDFKTSSGNCKIKMTVAGDYQFKIYWDNGTPWLKVKFPTTEFQACTYYFDNSQWKWGNGVKVYIWKGVSNDTWTMSQVEGSDYWVGTRSSTWTAHGFKFFSGTDISSQTNYTADMTNAPHSNWWATCYDPATAEWVLVGPKNVGITNTTSVVSGSGTENDPYIVKSGTAITVSASGDKIDNNTTVNYKFTRTGQSSTSYSTTKTYTVISNPSGGQTYSVCATVKTVRGENLSSREFTTDKLYYKVPQTALTLDKNNSDAGSTNGSANVTLGVGSLSSLTQPSRIGYTNKGYYKTADCLDADYISAAGGSLQKDKGYTDSNGKWVYTGSTLTLYTKWQAEGYKVTLDQTDATKVATYTQPSVTYDATLPTINAANKPSRDYYNFAGYWTSNGKTSGEWGNMLISDAPAWQEVANYTEMVNSNLVWKRAEDVTVYPKWTPIVYSYTFVQNGGSGATDGTYTYESETITLPVASQMSKTGYTFEGWYTEAEFTNKVTTIPAQSHGNKTFYANWTANTTLVTLTANGGTGDDQQFTATYDQVIDASGITKHTKEGYSLKGYYAAQSGGTYILNGNLVPNTSAVDGYIKGGGTWQYIGDAVTLYAQWQANKYTIALDNKGATTAGTESVEATFDGSFNPATIECPEKTDFVFGGYFVDDNTFATQLIGTDGKFIKGVASYTDASGNWIYPNTLTLYAKWTAASKPCSVNFGITDGTQIVARGTLTASVNGDSFISGNTITSGQTITLTYTNDVNNPAKVNAYTLEGYYQDITCQTPIQLSGTGNARTYVVADDVNFYAKVTVNQYTFTPIVSPENKGAINLVSGTQWIAGPNVPCEIQAVPVAGYSFDSWTTSSSQVVLVSNQEDATKTTVYLKNTDNTESVTATFTANTNTPYTVKHYKQNLDGMYPAEPTETDNLTGTTDTEVTPSTKEYEGFTAPATQTVTIAGNGTTVVEYQYVRKSYNISYTAQATGWTYGAKPTSAKFEENVAFVVNPTTGYTVAVTSSDVSLNGSAAPTYTFDMPAKDVQINVAATEILKPLTTSVNESYMGSVKETASSIGVATTSQLTATAANRNYKFKQWNLTNCTITSGTINNATITVKGDGVNNPSAEAEFEVAWLISGNEDISTGWDISGIKMTVMSDGVFKYEFNATKVASNDGDYNFKVYNTARKAYYANKEGDSGWWFTRGANSTTLAEDAQSSTNMSLRSDMVGNYIFTLDCSTSRENPTLTITFPTSTTYNVDIYYDGVTKTTVEGGAFAKSITANIPQSMRFDHWVVEGETTHVNIADVNSQTTTFTASGEGAVIRAKFKTEQVMYLKGGDKFGEAYVNFYSKNGYWSGSEGSGNAGSECMSSNNSMTKIGKTDIYYLDISGGISSWSWSQPFSFVNKSGNYKNFSMCNVVYRSDYNDRLPLYVPRYGWITDYFIECHYYNDGIWMKYNDTYSGYKLWIKEKNAEDATAQDVMLNALTPGGYEFNTKLNLKSGTTYELKIHNENGEWYGVSNQTITATSCTNWHFWKDNNNCQLTTSEAGDYTFVLNLGSGEVIVSVEYPLSDDDYRVVAKDVSGVKWEGDLIKNSGSVAKKDTTSFYNNNYNFQLQQYNGTGWDDVVGQSIASATLPESVRTQSIINFIVEQDGNNNATLAYKGIYTGNYYIRTDGVDGGWGDYKNNSDNKMDNYGSLIVADPDYQYDVYKAKWVPSGKNVKFRVANDYSKAISDEFTTDAIINDKETLPEGANVRFMWNSQTNQLKRAYLSGSAIPSDRYLILEGDDKMFDKNGNALTTAGGGKISGLDDYELNFDDKNNWVYQADIKAQPGCAVKLTAKYNGNIQYFIGKEGEEDGSRRTIIAGDESDTPYSLRAVYDFKTNRLVAGWIPSGTIENNIELGSDMLIERVGQDDASQIVFGGAEPSSLSISEIQHIYGVLKLTKETMVGATETDYDKCIYWISFPFDVKVSEIFGVEKYGEVWAISNYRGDLRAQKGWFKQDTQTFWEFLSPSDIMKANVGYTLNLDPDYFNKESSEPWKNSATEVAWYFPSIKEKVGIVSLAQKDTTLQPMHCTIDRTFDPGDGRTLNHKFTDSNWRVIGVPAFQNLQAPNFDPAPAGDNAEFGLKGFYEWVPSTNTYEARTTNGYTFKATGAYMVQYEGKITWSNAAVITTKAPWHAPEYTYADAKNYSITLEFGNDDYTDQTFVTLIEKASTDFVLNEDMMKIDNAGFPNIYSFAGAYDVAYNETTFDNQTVMLGVSAPKDGSYTFAMPKDFSGKAVLVDLESGEATDLNLSNYTVELNKGTYNNRFQLLLEVEAKAPTAIDNAKGEWSVDGKTKKLFINDQIYLINAGRIYNASGAQMK